ncbi:hypothetical protein VPH35_000016 [Triticum aestivum]
METDTPPAAAAPGVGAQTLALAVAVEDKATAKRARKRSRYLADYETPTILNTLHGDDDDDCIVTPPPPPPPRKGPALLLRLRQANVAAPDLLAALHRCAASPYEPPGTGGVDAGLLLGFFALHREAHHAGPSNADAALGGTGPSKRKKKKKKVTFALGAPASAAGAGCSAQLAATHSSSTGSASSAPKKPAKNKKAVNGQQHFSKPVALILQFAPGTAADQLPSKEQLHSTLRGFGPLIEPSTEITKKQARVVFQSSAAAEAAYSCVHTLGDFAAARLQYLRPPPPPPKIPLTDVRKNLERMIASLTGPTLLGKEDSAWSLAGEMQHLLVKVDRALNAGRAGPSTSAAAHHY